MYSPLDRKPANNTVTSCISSGFPDNLNQPFWLERGTVGLKCFDQEQCSETPSQPMDYSTQGPLNPGPLIPGPLIPGPLIPGPLNPGPLNPGPLKPESSILTTGPLYLPPWKEVLINIAGELHMVVVRKEISEECTPTNFCPIFSCLSMLT